MLHPLQVESYDSNLRLVVDEDENGKFRLDRVNINIVYDMQYTLNCWLLIQDCIPHTIISMITARRLFSSGNCFRALFCVYMYVQVGCDVFHV